ncbi:MAG: His/Gly/Thr/Pro-type tRNA ligase C-terminal domain-containing protein [Planctomycetes bacterium]|nr:His/Gly/Thr/Pro-type tRNA ligase C-terminal domain-containing protein [Planctomycetota bacterium]
MSIGRTAAATAAAPRASGGTASLHHTDHRAAGRALGLFERAPGGRLRWTARGLAALEALRALVAEEARALGYAPGEVAPAAAPDVSPPWLLDDVVTAEPLVVLRPQVDVAREAARAIALAGRLGGALGLGAPEVVVAGDAPLARALGARLRPAGRTAVEGRALDRLGRSWQVLRLEPDAGGLRGAVLGGAPRALALVLEHLAGALPPWLAPEQARLLPVGGAAALACAHDLAAALRAAGVPVTVAADGPLAGRVGAAAAARIPYLAFVGDEEVARGVVRVRARGGAVTVCVTRDGLMAHLTDDRRGRRLEPALPCEAEGPGPRATTWPMVGASSEEQRPAAGGAQDMSEKERLPSASR